MSTLSGSKSAITATTVWSSLDIWIFWGRFLQWLKIDCEMKVVMLINQLNLPSPQLWFAMDLGLIHLVETTQAAPSQNQEVNQVQAAASRCSWWARWGSPPATSASPTRRSRAGWRQASPTRSAATARGPTRPTCPPLARASCLSPRRTGTPPHPPPLKTSCFSPIRSPPALHWCPDSLYEDNQSDYSETLNDDSEPKIVQFVCYVCVQHVKCV